MRFLNLNMDIIDAGDLPKEILDTIEINELDLKYEKPDKKLLELLIPSSDVREYLDKIQFTLTPFAKAGLITRLRIPLFMQIDELRLIQSSLNKDDDLFNQIEDYIRYYINTYKMIIDNYDKDCFYVLYSYYDDRSVEERGVFLNYSDARECADQIYEEQDFCITKCKIIMDKSEVLICREFNYDPLWYILGTLDFDSHGQLKNCYSPKISKDNYSLDSFDNAYIFIPFPFRNGDIVRDLQYNSENNIGIITGPKNDDEMYRDYLYNDRDIRHDYSDYIINYESLFEEKSEYGDWGYTHADPLYLEFADKDDKFKNASPDSLEFIYYKAKKLKEGDDMFMSLKFFIDDWRKSKSDKPKE